MHSGISLQCSKLRGSGTSCSESTGSPAGGVGGRRGWQGNAVLVKQWPEVSRRRLQRSAERGLECVTADLGEDSVGSGVGRRPLWPEAWQEVGRGEGGLDEVGGWLVGLFLLTHTRHIVPFRNFVVRVLIFYSQQMSVFCIPNTVLGAGGKAAHQTGTNTHLPSSPTDCVCVRWWQV